MTIKKLTRIMKAYNREVAPGSECAAWGYYVDDLRCNYGIMPWADEADVMEPVQDFVDYWLSVADGKCADFDPDTGALRR